jgi:hypothetical protein
MQQRLRGWGVEEAGGVAHEARFRVDGHDLRRSRRVLVGAGGQDRLDSTYWWRLCASVITKAQVRRGLPSGWVRMGPAPKSTCAASPGSKLRRTVTSTGASLRSATSSRATEE